MYDRQFIKTTFGFLLNGSDEKAQTGLNWSVDAPWVGAEGVIDAVRAAPVVADNLILRMATLMLNANLNWANFSSLNTIRIAAIGTDGHEIGDAFVREDTTPAVGAVSQCFPQLTVCVTLASGFTAGTGNHGRMYLPHTHLPQGAIYKSTSATTALVAAAAKLALDDMTNDWFTGIAVALKPHIMSNFDPVRASKRVTKVGVGDVTDTQRRRRNQLPETYSYATLA